MLPSPTTRPKTTCLLSRKGVGTVVMKNWQPLLLGPAFCLWLGLDQRELQGECFHCSLFLGVKGRGGAC